MSKHRWAGRFLKSLAKTGNATLAAKATGISRRTVYDWRAKDPEFAATWDEALQEAVDVLHGIALKRATTGASDRLLIFLLGAADPAKYRAPNPYSQPLDPPPQEFTSPVMELPDNGSSHR